MIPEKPDPAILGPIDEHIVQDLPGWELDEGAAYWRWAVRTDQLYDDTVLPIIVKEAGACGGYSGICLGKPLTALFFYPRFE
jgi:hypothetical protein